MRRALVFLACMVVAGGWGFAASGRLAISYVKAPFNLQMIVMKELGLLEKELAPFGVEVSWPELTSGSKQAQALASGDLDVAGVMNSTSLLMAAGEGMPLRIIAGVARPAGMFALVGRKGGVGSVAELRGRVVVGPMGSVLHQLLVAVLRGEGMGIRDVKFINMDLSQGFAALQGGKVDAALLAGSMLIRAEEEGGEVLARAEGHVVPKLMMVVSQGFIDAYPERVEALRRAHDGAWEWIVANHAEAVALGAAVQGIGVEDAERLFAWSHFTQRVNAADLASMEDDMQFLLENGMMRRRVEVGSLVAPGAMGD